ncbi:MAG: membrane protein insertion efficiency factor YidD [Elusimicrobiota bacterium]|nr:membrane protein insertion efficiency factor YidD [Elusimicrobiota bacterium]
MKKLLLLTIKAFSFTLRPFLGPRGVCRFYPTCTAYALEAINKHGSIKGSWLAIKRVSKCHPFHPGGWDPVP